MRYREARTPQHMQTSRGIKAATGVLFAALAALGASLSATQVSSNDDLATLRRAFDAPPDDARIMMRWWWFGPQVTDEELGRELQAMKDAGIGGVEVQPVYPVALDDAANGLKTEPFLSDAFLAHLKFAADRAAALGLRFDLTLGSGWPYGGPTVSIDHAAGRLRIERVPIPPQASRVALPHVGAGESFIAGEIVAPGAWTRLDPSGAPLALTGPSLDVAADMRPRELVVFISSRTGQMVKRAAVGAEGFVLDHYDAAATSSYLSSIGERLWSAFGRTKPFAIFCDSLEVYDSDWTPNFPAEFERRRGYDITPQPAGAGVRRRAEGRRRPPRLGPDAHRARGRALHRAARTVGHLARHEAARTDLRHAAGVHVERDAGRSA